MSAQDHHGESGHEHAAELRNLSHKRLFLALALTASFLVVEVVAGIVSGSLALLSDAGHMLTDAGALGLALWARALALSPLSAPAPRQLAGRRLRARWPQVGPIL